MFGQLRSYLCDLCRIWSDFGHLWAGFDQIWAMMAEVGPLFRRHLVLPGLGNFRCCLPCLGRIPTRSSHWYSREALRVSRGPRCQGGPTQAQHRGSWLRQKQRASPTLRTGAPPLRLPGKSVPPGSIGLSIGLVGVRAETPTRLVHLQERLGHSRDGGAVDSGATLHFLVALGGQHNLVLRLG